LLDDAPASDVAAVSVWTEDVDTSLGAGVDVLAEAAVVG
jgi:hypothetical protein